MKLDSGFNRRSRSCMDAAFARCNGGKRRKTMKKRILRIIAAAVVFVIAAMIKPILEAIVPMVPQGYAEGISVGLFVISYFIAGGDVAARALKNIKHGSVLDENFLMTVATLGAFLIGEYPEGVAVMLFYQVGEMFQEYAVDRSRKSIAELMDIRPDYANVKRNGEFVRVEPREVSVGDIILVKAGEKVPLDGRVIEGSTLLDTSALTGESAPREATEGDEVQSGCINLSGAITVEVTKEFGESTVSRILDLVENAGSKKSRSEQFITRFARYYTPVVVAVAAFLATVPPLVIRGADFGDWVYRALSFLVVSCPCALVISIPLSFFTGIGAASREGILVKGGNYLEALAKTEVVVFDKTGTLTRGTFRVKGIYPVGIGEEKLLELAAHAESLSNHPISVSIKEAYGKEIDNGRISRMEEIPGHGISAEIDALKVLAGNKKLMNKMNIPFHDVETEGTIVHIAVNGDYAGYIVIADEIKPDSEKAMKQLAAAGIKNTVMLTGDNRKEAEKVAGDLGIGKVFAELLPWDKVEKVEELLAQKSAKGKLAFVGDGINDAPVLARADIGIAMGGLGSDAAIEAADIVIMTDEPSKIATAIRISKNTLATARFNSVFAIGIKVSVLVLSALGISTMWAAIFADVGVTVITVLNSIRGTLFSSRQT